MNPELYRTANILTSCVSVCALTVHSSLLLKGHPKSFPHGRFVWAIIIWTPPRMVKARRMQSFIMKQPVVGNSNPNAVSPLSCDIIRLNETSYTLRICCSPCYLNIVISIISHSCPFLNIVNAILEFQSIIPQKQQME